MAIKEKAMEALRAGGPMDLHEVRAKGSGINRDIKTSLVVCENGHVCDFFYREDGTIFYYCQTCFKEVKVLKMVEDRITLKEYLQVFAFITIMPFVLAFMDLIRPGSSRYYVTNFVAFLAWGYEFITRVWP